MLALNKRHICWKSLCLATLHLFIPLPLAMWQASWMSWSPVTVQS